MRTLEAIRKAGARVEEIVLPPLGLDDVDALVSDALHCTPEHAQSLAQLVHEKTDGNPFFAIHFLKALAEEGLLRRRSGCPSLGLGLGSYSRARLYRQRRGSHGREAKAIVWHRAGRATATRLSRKRIRDCQSESGFWGIRRGDPRVALGRRPRRANSSSAGLLRIPPRPNSGGGVRPYPRSRSRGGTPSAWTCATGRHDGGSA